MNGGAWLVLVILLAGLGAAGAHAAPAEPTPRERALAREGNALHAAGKHAEATARFADALRLREAATSAEDPSLLAGLRALAVTQAARGRRADALAVMQRALPIAEAAITSARAAFSEARMAAVLDYLRVDEELAYSLVADAPGDATLKRHAMTLALVRKGRLAEELRRTYAVLHDVAWTGEDAVAWQRLKQVKSRLAALALLGAGPAAELATLGRELRELEERLAQSTELAQLAAGALAMSTDTSLVVDAVSLGVGFPHVHLEIVAFRRYDFGAPGRGGRWKGREYLAMVMRSDGEIAAVPLGPAAPIEAAIAKLLAALADPAAAAHLRVAQDAYRRLVAPYRKHFDYPDLAFEHQSVYVSPDGEFHLLPFGALHDGKRYLLAGYNFVYVAAGREAGLLSRRAEGAARRVLVVADPDFSASVPAGQRVGSLTLPPPRLRGTRLEAAAIKRLVPAAELRFGRDATRRTLLAPPAPGVLHVATHGVFLEAAGRPAGESPLATAPPTRDADVDALTRLARSALILAGGDGGSGVLTALEIIGQDLRGTQLVVLSACETGRGDVRAGEGVYGLRRAFFAAGVETMVMSLWEVDDRATAELMEAFYRHLVQGRPPAQAIRLAADELRRAHPHPYYWAPFLVVGRTGRVAAVAGER